jgi:putative ABC transport system permease protein
VTALFRDLRFGLKAFARNPGMTAVAVLSLALAIGPNTFLFTIVDSIFLRPWPVENADQLYEVNARSEQGFEQFSYPDYLDYRDQNSVFSDLFVWRGGGAVLSMDGVSKTVWKGIVSDNYFSVLGVRPAAGRLFVPGDGRAHDGDPPVVISYGLWKTRFGGEETVIGRPVHLNNERFTIVGVASKNFNGLNWLVPVDFWAPVEAWPADQDRLTQRDKRIFSIMGRLRPGATKQQAEVEVNGIAGQLAEAYPATNAGRVLSLSFGQGSRERAGALISSLVLALVSLVLLVSCANVANLLLALADNRRRETAVRLAIGAGRARLIRQLLTESAALSLVGAAIGVGLAFWLTKLLPTLQPPGMIPLNFDIQMDGRVLLYTFALSVITTIIFGLVPALQASSPDLTPALKGEEVQVRRGARRFSFKNLLVVAQVTVSVFLMVGTGLLLRSYWNTEDIPTGFDGSKQMVLMTIVPRSQGDFQNAVEQAEAAPGVVRVSFARHFPMSGSGVVSREVSIPGMDPETGQPATRIRYNEVGSEYFQTMGTRVLRGRGFQRHDRVQTTRVVMINEAMAHRFWPNDDALGDWFEIEGESHQVVGIVEDGKYDTLREPVQPFMFLLCGQEVLGEVSLLIETAVEASSLAGTIRENVSHAAPELWIVNAVTLREQMRFARYLDQMSTGLFGGLCLLAVLLSAAGLFGVVSNSASRRRREIAVRVAMGASRSDIAKMILGHGLRLAMAGLPFGLASAYVAASYIGSLLYGVAPFDPVSYLAGSLTAVAIAVAASQAPAWKAMNVHPATILRNQ